MFKTSSITILSKKNTGVDYLPTKPKQANVIPKLFDYSVKE